MKLHRFAIFAMTLLLSLTAFAEDTYRLNADYFIRSTPRFRAFDRNKVGVLARGSTFKVLERRRRSDNSSAVRIEIQDRARGSSVRRSRQQWIYMSGSRNFTRVTTTETEGTTTAAGACTTGDCSPGGNRRDLQQLTGALIDGENTGVVPAPAPAPAPAPPPAPVPVPPPVAPAPPPAAVVDAAPPAVVAPPPVPPTESARGPLAQQIRNYSDSTEVRNMIDWAMANKRPHSIGLCYRLVKEALANQCGVPRRREYTCRNARSTGGRNGPGNNLTPAWFGDNRAYNAKNTLKQYGFVNLMEREPYRSQITRPEQAPKGAILVYSSGRVCRGAPRNSGDCGHIEIKTGEPNQPGYVSDYALDRPITNTRNGGRYRLVGVMIKPGVQ